MSSRDEQTQCLCIDLAAGLLETACLPDDALVVKGLQEMVVEWKRDRLRVLLGEDEDAITIEDVKLGDMIRKALEQDEVYL